MRMDIRSRQPWNKYALMMRICAQQSNTGQPSSKGTKTAGFAYIREIVFTEWWARTTDSKWVMQPSKVFNKNNSTMAVAARTLNDIAIYHGKIGAMSYMAEMSCHQLSQPIIFRWNSLPPSGLNSTT
jgi:hypothetical protein